jgi:hypothetical protein
MAGVEMVSEEHVDGIATIRGIKPDFIRFLKTM